MKGKPGAAFARSIAIRRATKARPASGDRGTAYPHATLTGDGRILLVSGQGSKLRRRFLIDPDWLVEREQKETFKNIEAWHLFKEFGPVKRWWRDRLQGPQWIDHPEEPGRKALHIRRPDEMPGDGAVWNFPAARAGKLTLRIRIGERFGGGANQRDRSILQSVRRRRRERSSHFTEHLARRPHRLKPHPDTGQMADDRNPMEQHRRLQSLSGWDCHPPIWKRATSRQWILLPTPSLHFHPSRPQWIHGRFRQDAVE